MEQGQFQKIQGWFEHLDRKVEGLDHKVDGVIEHMVTKQQFENRHQALVMALMNLHHKIEGYKDRQDEEISLLKRAIHDIEEELKQLAERRS